MAMFGISFPGSGGAYGTFETLPGFNGLGYAAHLFGSSFTATPAANLFETSTAGNALLYGTNGALGLTLSGAAFTGVIAGNLLTVSGYTAGGEPIAAGHTLYNSNGIQVGRIAPINAGTGTGGNGTYTLEAGSTATASQSMTSVKNAADLPGNSASAYNGAAIVGDITGGVLTVSAVTRGTALVAGDAIYSTGGIVLAVLDAFTGTGTGGVGTYPLKPGWVATAAGTTMYRGSTAGVGGMTIFAVAKGNTGGLVSDYVANQGSSMALQFNAGATTVMAVMGAGGGSIVNSQAAMPSNPTTAWALYIAQFTATTVQAMQWRTATGLVAAGATALPTTGGNGSTTNKMQVGRPYGLPNATVAGAAVYRGALTQAQILSVAASFSSIMADVGQAL